MDGQKKSILNHSLDGALANYLFMPCARSRFDSRVIVLALRMTSDRGFVASRCSERYMAQMRLLVGPCAVQSGTMPFMS